MYGQTVRVLLSPKKIADNVDKYSFSLGHHVSGRKLISRKLSNLHCPTGHSPVSPE